MVQAAVAAPLSFAFVDFHVRQKKQTKNQTIMIFEFFILSANNDKQLIQYLLFDQELLMAESSASTLLRYQCQYSR